MDCLFSLMGAHGASDGRELAHLLTRLPCLRQFSIRCSSRRYLGDKGSASICASLPQCQSLVSLDLTACRMSHKAFRELAEALKGDSKVVSLFIDSNHPSLRDWRNLLPGMISLVIFMLVYTLKWKSIFAHVTRYS